MTRLSTSTILKAYQQNPLLPLLLQECRTLQSAQNELRWLREKAVSITKLISARRGKDSRSRYAPLGWRNLLRSMCRARSRGMPLQYILGDQPFGDLEILCRRGVLIPRPETESWTFHTAQLILEDLHHYQSEQRSPLQIIDLCSGTGCISLLLHSLLAPHVQQLSILGIDISPVAIQLARKNIEHNLRLGLLSDRALTEVSFRQGDVLGRNNSYGLPTMDVIHDYMLSSSRLETPMSRSKPQCDVIISNPPYISPESFWDGTTARSVRIFEPKLALVPPVDTHTPVVGLYKREDIFYHRIILLSFRLGAKLTVLECGDRLQARRVVAICNTLADDCREVDIWPSSGADNESCAVVLKRRPPVL